MSNRRSAAARPKRLNEIDSVLVLPMAEAAMKHADQHVREQGAAAYLKLPTVERIGPLGQLLDDPDPELRRHVCEGLVQLAANSELNDRIRLVAMEVIAGERWRGQEQAALLLGSLEHKDGAKRFVELLESPREEVMISAAWALRKLAVPETDAPIIDKAKRQTAARLFGSETGDRPRRVAHLFEARAVILEGPCRDSPADQVRS